MIRFTTVAITLVLLGLTSAQPAVAQDNTVGGALLGGAAGAIIGGAATGKAGGAVAGGIIGAAAGAMLGSQLDPRPGGYYWYDGRCWVRYGDGSYHRVPRRYCY
ncbi:MAG TPA: glycine zipper domain-containing protein [Pseudolabrys sp.]